MYRIPPLSEPFEFPTHFTTSPEGLLALGGNLHPLTLLSAYSKGIFPWYNSGEPILWWHPDPRLVLFPKKIHIARSMLQWMKKHPHTISFNQDFAATLEACGATTHPKRQGTWLLPELKKSLITLHNWGYAHSVEVRNERQELVGGLYGLALGRVFFGESMFSYEPNTSKLALFTLCHELIKHDFILIDCQVATNHLKSLGAIEISRIDFLKFLKLGNTDQKTKTIF